MVRRRGGGIPRRLIVLAAAGLLVGCSGPAGTSTTVDSPPVTTAVPPTSAVSSTTTTTLPEIGATVLVPEGEGPFPTVVLVHGGGWVTGSPALMAGLASYLTENGYLTVNTAYTLAGETPGFPQAVDDVACAIRYAGAHPQGDGSVTVVGHSAGAHIGALAALDEGSYGEGCPIGTVALVDRLVGLAGPYQVARLGPLLFPFFGVTPADDPELWEAGDPLAQVEGNPGLRVLLLHGEEDTLVDLSFATDFAAALTDAGKEVQVEIIPDADHSDMYDPDYVGAVIVDWLGPGT